jgi:hypothetical protein
VKECFKEGSLKPLDFQFAGRGLLGIPALLLKALPKKNRPKAKNE